MNATNRGDILVLIANAKLLFWFLIFFNKGIYNVTLIPKKIAKKFLHVCAVNVTYNYTDFLTSLGIRYLSVLFI